MNALNIFFSLWIYYFGSSLQNYSTGSAANTAWMTFRTSTLCFYSPLLPSIPSTFPPFILPSLLFLRSSSPTYVFLRLHRVASRDSSSSSIILNDRSCWRSNWFSQTSDSSQADAAGGGEGGRAAREGVNVRRREANGK